MNMRKKPVIINFRPTDEDWKNMLTLMQLHQRGTTNLIRWLLAEEIKRQMTQPLPPDDSDRIDF